MLILQKGNIEKIVFSEAEAAKLILRGFKAVSDTKDNQEQTAFGCPACEKSFKTQAGLDKHLADKHKDKGGETNGGSTASADTGGGQEGAEAQ